MNELNKQEMLNFLAGETTKLNELILKLTQEFYKTVDPSKYRLKIVSGSAHSFMVDYFCGLEKCLKALNIK